MAYRIRLASAGLLVGLLLLTAAAASGAAPPWSGPPIRIGKIDIQVEDPYPDGLDWPALARAVIGLSAGDELTPEKLAGSVEALAPLAKVRTRVEDAHLTYVLKPFKRIKSIDVDGSYPLFEQDVRDAMTLRVGAVFSPEAVPGQHALVVRRYKDEGYIDPRVRVDWRQDSGDGHYRLQVVIDKGPYFALQEVRLRGNRLIDGGELKARMSSWRRAIFEVGLGRFQERRIQKDVKALVDYYRKQGFADAAIDYEIIKDPKNRSVRIDVRIEEGPRYQVSLKGNRYFPDRALEKELVLREMGNQGNIGIYRSLRNLRRRYLKAGFADVHVRRGSVPAPEDPDRREVVIEIEEGSRHLVRSVTIQGNRHVDRETIREQLLTRRPGALGGGAYVAEVLQEDLAAIQELYRQRGYLNARIGEQVAVDKNHRVDVTIAIEEGVTTRVGRIVLTGDPPIAADKLLADIGLETDTPFDPQVIRRARNRLANRIAVMGYPHVHVDSRIDESADRASADIEFQVSAGNFVQVGPIFFTGNFRTRAGLLMREAGLTPGTPFDLAKVTAVQRNLYETNLFESVQVRTIGLKEKASRVPLLVEVVEKKPDYFEAGAGFETAQGPFLRAKVGDRNFRGANRHIWLGGEVSGIGHRLETGMTAPGIFGTKIRADLGLFLQRQEEFNQDFGVDTYGGSLNLTRRMSRFIVAGLAWRYEDRDQFLREGDASTDVDPDTLEPRRILVTTPTIWYDSRDSFTRPRSGWYARATMDISRGLENDLDDFRKYQVDLRHYRSPWSRLTLAAMARAGYLISDSEDRRVPEDQLFFLGGTTDVRGFGENLLRFDAENDPIGGRVALSGSIEARYDVGRNFEITAFVDGGSVQSALVDAGEDDWRWSAGLGVSYITPIGPISLYYGRKLDPLPGEDSGQFHFSIGYTF